MWNKIKEKASSNNFNSFLRFVSFFSGIFLIMGVILTAIIRNATFAYIDTSLKNAANQIEVYANYEVAKLKYDEERKASTEVEATTETSMSTSETSTTSQSSSSSSGEDNEATSTSASDSQSEGSVVSSHSKQSDDTLVLPPSKPIEDDDGNKKPKPEAKLPYNVELILFDSDGNPLNVDDLSSLNFIAEKIKFSNLNHIKSDSVTADDYTSSLSYHYYVSEYQSELDDLAIQYAVAIIDVTTAENAMQQQFKAIVATMLVFWILSIWASYHLAIWSSEPIKIAYEKQKVFVENASHELRTPLAVLQNRLESLFRSPDSTIMDNYENIASSLDEVRNMRLLTTNLLNLARRDDGIQVTLEDVDRSFFNEIFDNYEMIAEEQEKEFSFINNLSNYFSTDKTLIRQLMTILFDNAVKYTGNDGKIFAKVDDDDKNIIISFADNGPGISDDDKEKVFERFYRIDKARTRQKGGFGLGLSLAKQIVEALNGKIQIVDNQPTGAIFEVKLPLKQQVKD